MCRLRLGITLAPAVLRRDPGGHGEDQERGQNKATKNEADGW